MNPALANARPLDANTIELIKRECARTSVDKVRRSMDPVPSGSTFYRGLSGDPVALKTYEAMTAFAASLVPRSTLPPVTVGVLTAGGHPIQLMLRGDEAAWLGESRRCYTCQHLVRLHQGMPHDECLLPGCSCKHCDCEPCREA